MPIDATIINGPLKGHIVKHLEPENLGWDRSFVVAVPRLTDWDYSDDLCGTSFERKRYWVYEYRLGDGLIHIATTRERQIPMELDRLMTEYMMTEWRDKLDRRYR